MITLVVDPRDPELLRPLTADGSRVRSITASIRPSRDRVRLTDGGFITSILPARESASTTDSPIAFVVPPTDDPDIHADDRSTFEYIVDVEIGGSRGRGRGGSQVVTFRGMLPTSLGATVQVTALIPGAPLPPPLVTVAELSDKVVAAEAAATSAATSAAAAEAAKFPKGIIADGTDINTIRTPGVYVVPTTVSAGTMLNWPAASPARAGTLTVIKADSASATTQDVIVHVSNTGAVERYTRSTLTATNSSWSPWSLVGWVKGTLNGSDTARVNVDTYRTAGAWVISSRTYVDGLPGTAAGLLEVLVTPATGWSVQRFTERLANSDVVLWQRFSISTGGWAGVAWDKVGDAPTTTAASDVQVSDHATRVEYARARRGGGIGVQGFEAVVMVRFDHWQLAFRDKVLPILRTYSLPATLNVNYDNIGNAQNGGGAITWAHVQDWNQYDGIEIANHGATHTDANTRASIYHEIVEGRRLLETAMPRVAVETWHEHGSAYLTATDIAGDPGLNLGRTPSSFTESYAGRLVMAEHAVVEGKCGGFFVPLTGSPQIGQSHYSIDQSTDAEAIAQVDNAKLFGKGLTLYVHPGLLDTVLVGGAIWPATYGPGEQVVVTNPADSSTQTFATEAAYQSWATTNGHTIYMRTSYFTALCAYLAAERAAGRVMVMTAAGGAFADKSHARRENLLVKSDFTSGYTSWWTGLTGWTVGTPGAAVTLTSNGSPSTLSQTMLLHSRFGWAMGAAHELVVRVKAGAATNLTLTVEKAGDAATWQATRTHAIPGDNVERDYRLNITLPRDPNITQMSVKLAGANLTIVGPPRLVAI